jgi:hypothetical protein
MKAVVYYAYCPRISYRFPIGLYEDLMVGLRENLNSHGVPLIHITLEGHEGLGNDNIFFEGDPDWVNYNREVFFTEFLQTIAEPGETYWFTEPDARLNNHFPELKGDAAFTVRENRISPAWRLAKKTAYPIFQEAVELFPDDKCKWQGDSEAWAQMYYNMGYPGDDNTIQYKNLNVELRRYKLYNMTGSYYSQQYKANQKFTILSDKFNSEKK